LVSRATGYLQDTVFAAWWPYLSAEKPSRVIRVQLKYGVTVTTIGESGTPLSEVKLMVASPGDKA
jgi:hypothetical protein